jgi:hypothetical protein
MINSIEDMDISNDASSLIFLAYWDRRPATARQAEDGGTASKRQA